MMKKLILLTLLFISTTGAKAQEQQNIADLDQLYKSIRELPSYKDQLKNDKSYHQLYQALRKDLNTNDELVVFQKLAKLIIPLRDNHLSLARKPDSNAKFTPSIPHVDLLELRERLKKSHLDSVEGVYYQQNVDYLVYKMEENTYYLQNLTTKELKAILYLNSFGSFDVIQFRYGTFPYVLTRNIKLVNGLLVGLNYVKDTSKTYYSILERKDKYEYKVLENEVGYLSLGTFNSSDKSIKAATDFFNEVKPEIKVKTLIVDVRNNGGGGYKTSGQFIAFLAKFNGDLYILQNAYTVSNAEQFILKLKERRKVIILGETTRGTITYGNNYGNRITLPSNRFTFYPTDMKGLKKELLHETVGVKPDVVLDPFTEDWITQTLKQIKK